MIIYSLLFYSIQWSSHFMAKRINIISNMMIGPMISTFRGWDEKPNIFTWPSNFGFGLTDTDLSIAHMVN